MNGQDKVWDAVETFRRQHLVRPGGALPVDVFSVVELQLRLDVIPFPDLQASKLDKDRPLAAQLATAG
jgi:hypothetical protein